MIVTQGLTKRYGNFEALTDVTLEVRRGEVFGLLGPNGSGKTTMIRVILGLLKPTSGRAEVAGFASWKDSLQVRRLVSYLPGELRLYGHMTGFGLLKFLSSLRGGVGFERAESIASTIMKLDLNRKVRTFSTGMKQKLALAQTFADPVEVLILDEPTSALDPSARQDVLDLVIQARNAGQTVVFSGHVLAEVEQVADRLAIMRKGHLMHVEDMHARRSVRMLLLKFAGGPPESYPDELQLTLRESRGEAVLVEHRGEIGPLLGWLASRDVVDLAIGTDDLRSLYERYHGPIASDGANGGNSR